MEKLSDTGLSLKPTKAKKGVQPFRDENLRSLMCILPARQWVCREAFVASVGCYFIIIQMDALKGSSIKPFLG
jgi:hypothetical protein